MPGYNQTQLNYKVLNGNACSLFVGDHLIGFATASSPAWDMGTDAYYGIGSSKPQEIQQLRMSMTINVDKLRLTAEGESFFGESTPLVNILANNQFNIYVSDISGNPFLAYVGCVASNEGTNITTNAAVSETISFLAMDILDVDGNSILNGNNALAGVNFLSSAAAGASLPTAP